MDCKKLAKFNLCNIQKWHFVVTQPCLFKRELKAKLKGSSKVRAIVSD